MTILTDTIKELRDLIAKNKSIADDLGERGENCFSMYSAEVAMKSLPKFLDAAEKAERYEKALLRIETTPYRIYDGNKPFVSDHDSGYAMGVADGHRLAARWATEAIAPADHIREATKLVETKACKACGGLHGDCVQ